MVVANPPRRLRSFRASLEGLSGSLADWVLTNGFLSLGTTELSDYSSTSGLGRSAGIYEPAMSVNEAGRTTQGAEDALGLLKQALCPAMEMVICSLPMVSSCISREYAAEPKKTPTKTKKKKKKEKEKKDKQDRKKIK